jgi:hypothetical protein
MQGRYRTRHHPDVKLDATTGVGAQGSVEERAMSGDVFISYSRHGEEFVLRLVNDVEAAG